MEARSQLRHRPTLSRRDSLILKLSAAIVNVWSAWVAPRSGPCTRPVSYSWPRSIPTCSGAESPLPATRRVIWSYLKELRLSSPSRLEKSKELSAGGQRRTAAKTDFLFKLRHQLSNRWVAPEDLQSIKAVRYAKGTKVEVLWKKHWYAATVLQAKDGVHLIHYTDYESKWDEWVPSRRIREPRS